MSDACGAIRRYRRAEGVLGPTTGPSEASGPEEVR
ncbi:MAG: hypothetical protein QOG01_2270 [Pseudonocardiales bacterium]|nr:hypothetical protein [Pseudonocardiales bacterium]